MSNFSLPQNPLFSFTSIPLIAESLLLIETKKQIPCSTLSFFDKNVRDSELDIQDQENSLELSLNAKQKSEPELTEVGTPAKKKKTGCICKKTKCLKMYCECFSSGKLCTPECTCYGCNNQQNFQSLIEKAKESIKQKNQFSSNSLKESKGCNCKKSQCQKKYCQCFNAGLPCGEQCKCQQCANNEQPQSIKQIKQSNQE